MMKKTDRRRFLKAAAAGSAIAAFGAPAIVSGQSTIRWRCQSMWSASELTYKVFQDFCEQVKTLTGGRLEIEPFPAGAVVGAFETFDAVSAGVLQAQSSAPVYWSGKDPGFAVIGDLNFAYRHPWQAEAWFYHRGGYDMLREAYARYNVYPVGVTWWGVESIVSKKPIRSMADFKGLKFRSPQGMVAEVMTKLGASTVVVPGGEVYSSLDKGVVDAADWGTLSMNQRMGFFEVAKYPVVFGHSMPMQDFAVNANAWKELPDDLKAIVSTAVREWAWDQIQRIAVEDVRVLKELKSSGVELIEWSDEELGKIRALAQKTWEEWSRKSPLAKKAYDSQIAWLKELGAIA